MADALRSGRSGFTAVKVQLLSSAPFFVLQASFCVRKVLFLCRDFFHNALFPMRRDAEAGKAEKTDPEKSSVFSLQPAAVFAAGEADERLRHSG